MDFTELCAMSWITDAWYVAAWDGEVGREPMTRASSRRPSGTRRRSRWG